MSNLEQEKTIQKYLDALEHGDADALNTILLVAEHDRVLSQMIVEVHEALDAEMPAGEQPSPVYPIRSSTMQITNSRHWNGHSLRTGIHTQPRHKRYDRSLTLVAAVIVTLLFSGLLIYQQMMNNHIAPSSVTIQQVSQEEVFTRYINEAWNEGNTAVLDDVLTLDHNFEEEGGRQFTGQLTLAAYIREQRGLLEDFHLEINETIVDENVLWAHLTLSGSGIHAAADQNQGLDQEFNYDKPITIPVVMIVRFRGEQINETWMDMNYSSIMWDVIPFLIESEVIPQVYTKTEQQNIDSARRAIDDVWNDPDVTIETMRELYASRVVVTWGASDAEAQVTSPTPLKDTFDVAHEALPDLHLSINDIAADGDVVYVRYTAQGTFEKDICTECGTVDEYVMKATGEQHTWGGTFVYTMLDGKINEERWYMDLSYFFMLYDSFLLSE